MSTLALIVDLAAGVATLLYAWKRQWKQAVVALVICFVAVAVKGAIGGARGQSGNNFPLPLNSGAGAAGAIPGKN